MKRMRRKRRKEEMGGRGGGRIVNEGMKSRKGENRSGEKRKKRMQDKKKD